MKPQYSIAAHLIHSRLEMIRHRMQIDKGVQIPNIVWHYKKVFEKASASVLASHGITCEYKDQFHAAEMLYNSFYPNPSKNARRWVAVEYTHPFTGIKFDIQGIDQSKRPVPADPGQRFTDDEARVVYDSLGAETKHYALVTRYEEPDL